MGQGEWEAMVGHSPDWPFAFARSYKRMTSSYDLKKL